MTIPEPSAQTEASIHKAFEYQSSTYKIPTFSPRVKEPIFIPVNDSRTALRFIFLAVQSSAPKELPLGSRIISTNIKMQDSGNDEYIEVHFKVDNRKSLSVTTKNIAKSFSVQRTPLGYLLIPQQKKTEGLPDSPQTNTLVLVARAHSKVITNAFIISTAQSPSAEIDSPIQPVLQLSTSSEKGANRSFMSSESQRLDATLGALPACFKNPKACDKGLVNLLASSRAIDTTPLPAAFKRIVADTLKKARTLLFSKSKPSPEELEKLTREVQVIRHWKLFYDLHGHLPPLGTSTDGSIRIAAVITVGPPQPVASIIPTRQPSTTPVATPTPPSTPTKTPPPVPSNTPTQTPNIRPSVTPTVTPTPSRTRTKTVTPTASATPTQQSLCTEFKEPSATRKNPSVSLTNLKSSGALWLHIFELGITSTLPPVRADEADSFSSATKKACYIATGGSAFDSRAYSFLQLKFVLPGPFSSDAPFTPMIGSSRGKLLVCVTLCPICAPQVMQGYADKYIRGWLL